MKVKGLIKHFTDNLEIELYNEKNYENPEYTGFLKDLRNAGKSTYEYSNVVDWYFTNNKLIVDIT